MKLLVTGGAGFIGSNFIKYWLESHPKDTIINLDKLTYAGNFKNTESFQDNPQYSFVKGDICNESLVNKIMKDINTVVHFAAESHVDRSIKNPTVFFETNVKGTQILLEAALKNNIERFHHISTDEVYGELKLNSKDKFTETTPYDPRSPYAASKAASDHLVRSYFHTYNLPITISNCSNNYGPYQSPEKFIPRSITNLLQNIPIKIYGDGKYVRDWLYVTDHCIAIEQVIMQGKVGETYIVGGLTKDITNLELAKSMLNSMQKDNSLIEFVKDRPGHDKRYAVDWTKIKEKLGWKPKYSFEKGLASTINWYKNNTEYWQKSKIEVEKFYNN